MRTPRRCLGDVLELELDQVEVEAAGEYNIAGVYSFGRGLFTRGPIAGSATSYKRLNRLHAGQLVLSRLKAFEGAIAVVPDDFDGWFLSPEFPTFRCESAALDPTYLAHICRWPDFWSMLAATSKGVGARRERVHPQALLGLEIPLPPIDEQRRVATWLSAVDTRVRSIMAKREDTEPWRRALLPAIRARAFSELSGLRTPLHEIAVVEMGQSPPGHSYNDRGDGFPLLNGPTEFGPEVPVTRQWTTSVTKIAEPGDLLICVRGATTGRMNWADQRYCIGRGLASIRPREGVLDPQYLRQALLHLAPEIMSRTAGSTFANLPGKKLMKLPIPLPSLDDQRRLGSHLEGAEQVSARAAIAWRRARLLADAVLPSALNHAFAEVS